jgi:hemoglobin
MPISLFEKYGGFAKVSRIVLTLYDRLLEDDEIGPFFDNIDMARIVDHQTKFISSLLGGPASFTDDDIARRHAHLAISDAHFDRLKQVLGATLKDHGMQDEDIATVVQAFEKRRKLVVE